MDDLRLLKVLREVALRGSFSAAAEALSYSQPAVSQQIARLESQAGVKLIERQPKGVRLTAAGAGGATPCPSPQNGAAAGSFRRPAPWPAASGSTSSLKTRRPRSPPCAAA